MGCWMTSVMAGAPAPGSLKIPRLVEGALDGGCPSTDKAQAPSVKGVRIYADIHKKARNGEGYRITSTVDGITFRHVDSFSEIPANAGDKLLVDVLPLKHTNGALELLRRGVELYCPRRLTLIKKKREELKLPKTTRADIKALMNIEQRWFRKDSENFLIMRQMISAYRGLLKTHQKILNIGKATGANFEDAIKSLEKEMHEMAKQIAGEAGKRYPAYNRLVEELCVGGNTTAMEALAELVVYLNPAKGFRRARSIVGLFKPAKRCGKKFYDGRLRQALQRLTASANNISPYQLTARMEKGILFKVWLTYRQETQGRLDIPAQG